MTTTAPAKIEPASCLQRAFAVVEVMAIFAITHLLLKSFKQLTNLGTQERSAGLNFSPGLIMIAVLAMVLLVRRGRARSFGLWPLTLPRRSSRPPWKKFLIGLLLYAPPLLLFLYFKHGHVWLVFVGLLSTTALPLSDRGE